MENRSQHQAARLLFSGSDKPSRILRDLCEHLVDIDGSSLKLSEAVQLVEGLPTSTAALMQLMQNCSCLNVQGTSSSNLTINLNVDALLQQAKQATSTGILKEELAPPVGYAYGKHPIRPAQRACPFFVKNGTCGFGRACVFNHPVSNPKDIFPNFRGSSGGGSASSSSGGGAGANGAAVHAAGPAAGNNFAAAGPRPPIQQHYQQPPLPLPHNQQQPYQQHQLQLQPTSVLLPPPFFFPQQPSQPPQQQLPQPPPPPPQQQQQAVPPRPSSAGPVRPGQLECFMMRTRGFCTAGPACPYDHTPAGPSMGSSNGTEAANSKAAARPQSASQQQQQQQQEQEQQAPTPPVQAQARSAAAAAAGAASSSSSSSSAAAAAGSSYPRTHEQQQQLLQRQQTYIAQMQQQKAIGLQGFAYPVIGTLPGGYPQRPGAANCPFYQYSGDCKFKKGCVYHHPERIAMPEKFVLTGLMSARWARHEPAPYYRLVMHLDRLWDYTSCPEAQLKTWLARHLLAEANPSCAMWQQSAAADAVPGADGWSEGDRAAAAAAGLQPLGPYSCSLADAEAVLQRLWQEQPDAGAASHPMPYSQLLRELLATDPYYEVAPGTSSSSSSSSSSGSGSSSGSSGSGSSGSGSGSQELFVRLRVSKIKEMLNW